MTTVSATTIWVEKARTLAPIIEQYRDEGEHQRHLAKPLYEAIRSQGLFKLWLPRDLGGEELDFPSVTEVIEALAYMDGSAAWNLVIALQSGWLLGFLDHDTAGEMMADNPNATLGGSGQPNGIAIPVDGGYRVSGRWPFASGSNHTRWLCGVSRIKDGDGFRLNDDGKPQIHFFFFSSDQYHVLDTWNTTGLRATGSNDFEVNDVFVPEGRHINVASKSSLYQTGTLFQTRFQQIFGWPLAFVALGVAAEAIDAFAELADAKTPTRGTKRLADSDQIHMTLGRAMARLNSGRSYLRVMSERLWKAMQDGHGDDDALYVEVSLATANAAESAADAVDLVRTAAGSSGVFVGNKIERCWRDVHMVTQHAGGHPSNFGRAGAYRLGLGLTTGR